jgi:hypothetical protein
MDYLTKMAVNESIVLGRTICGHWHSLGSERTTGKNVSSAANSFRKRRDARPLSASAFSDVNGGLIFPRPETLFFFVVGRSARRKGIDFRLHTHSTFFHTSISLKRFKWIFLHSFPLNLKFK